MARAKKQFIVDGKGRKQAVILSIQEYQELLKDLEDLAVIAERKSEPTTPLDKVVKELEEKWQRIES